MGEGGGASAWGRGRVAGPEEVGDGVGGVGGHDGFEAGEVAGDGLVFVAGGEGPQGLDRERVPAAGEVGAEGEEDRGAGQDGQVGPDGEEGLRAAEQAAGAGVGAAPGGVARQVDGQAGRQAPDRRRQEARPRRAAAIPPNARVDGSGTGVTSCVSIRRAWTPPPLASTPTAAI